MAQTFEVKHNNEDSYLVDPFILCSVSEWFRDQYLVKEAKEIHHRDSTTEDVFRKFIQIVQLESVEFNVNEALQLLRLAESWQVPQLKKDLNAFILKVPESEMWIAKLMDDYLLTKQLPSAKSFTVEDLEELLSHEAMHELDKKLLMSFMMMSKRKKISPRVLNAFIVKHMSLKPDDSTEIAQYIVPEELSNLELDALLSNPGTFNLRSVQLEKARRGRNTVVVEKTVERVVAEPKGPFLKITPPFYGLFAAISVLCGGDPVTKGKIAISASSNDPKSLIDERHAIVFDNANPQIRMKLPYSVAISGYQIEVRCPMKWKLSGSHDGKVWHTIDSHKTKHVEDSKMKRRQVGKQKEYAWYNLRLVCEDDKPPSPINSIELFSEDFPDGVCRSLSSMILVTASNNELHRLASPRHRGMWFSHGNEQEQWVQFEFKECTIVPEYYTLKSGPFWFLKTWKVMGSMNGFDWFILDERSDTGSLSKPYGYGYWRTKTSRQCKYLRIVHVKSAERRSQVLCLSGVEFFGDMVKQKADTNAITSELEHVEEVVVHNPYLHDSSSKSHGGESSSSSSSSSSESELPRHAKVTNEVAGDHVLATRHDTKSSSSSDSERSKHSAKSHLDSSKKSSSKNAGKLSSGSHSDKKLESSDSSSSSSSKKSSSKSSRKLSSSSASDKKLDSSDSSSSSSSKKSSSKSSRKLSSGSSSEKKSESSDSSSSVSSKKSSSKSSRKSGSGKHSEAKLESSDSSSSSSSKKSSSKSSTKLSSGSGSESSRAATPKKASSKNSEILSSGSSPGKKPESSDSSSSVSSKKSSSKGSRKLSSGKHSEAKLESSDSSSSSSSKKSSSKSSTKLSSGPGSEKPKSPGSVSSKKSKSSRKLSSGSHSEAKLASSESLNSSASKKASSKSSKKPSSGSGSEKKLESSNSDDF